MDEFALIDAIVAELGDVQQGPGIVLGPGDDAAVIAPPAGHDTVASIDNLVVSVHFPAEAAAELVGYRAMGVAFSDIAAMAAEPAYGLLAVTTPDGDETWLTGFARGVAAAARRFGCSVIGGNLARGALNVALSAHGWVPRGAALTRSGAAAGDRILVSGMLGGPCLALDDPELLWPRGLADLDDLTSSDRRFPLKRYYLPTPRFALAAAMRDLASAAVDISDGLVADLGHLCRASSLAAEISLEDVPCVPGRALRTGVCARTGGRER
jgi:thiamine-monophosphate kinase